MLGNKYDKPKSGIRISMPVEVAEEKRKANLKEGFERGQASIIRIIHEFALKNIDRQSIQIEFDPETTLQMNFILDSLQRVQRQI